MIQSVGGQNLKVNGPRYPYSDQGSNTRFPVTWPVEIRTRESLLDQADKAMYLGKSLGRNRVCSADQLTGTGIPRRAR